MTERRARGYHPGMAGEDNDERDDNKPIPCDGRAFWAHLRKVMQQRFGCADDAACMGKLVEIRTVRFREGRPEPTAENPQSVRRRLNAWRSGESHPSWGSVRNLVAFIQQQPGQKPIDEDDLIPEQPAVYTHDNPPEGQKNLQNLRLAICEILQKHPSLAGGLGGSCEGAGPQTVCDDLVKTGADQVATLLVQRLKKLRSERDPAADDLQRLLWLVLTVAADWVDFQKQDATANDDAVLELRLRTATVAEIAVARHEQEACSFAPVFTDGEQPRGTMSIPLPAATYAPFLGRLDSRQPELLKKTFLGHLRDAAYEAHGNEARYPFWKEIRKANPSIVGFANAAEGEIDYQESKGRKFYLLYMDELLTDTVEGDLDAHWKKAVATFRAQMPALRLVRLRGLEGEKARQEYRLVPPIRDAILKGKEI
ncbi:MAG: hypothetical protein IPK82_44315 [Polyangiaceae bacterium]|nr:hypothetical protein [Polyangiaceae bacterium]